MSDQPTVPPPTEPPTEWKLAEVKRMIEELLSEIPDLTVQLLRARRSARRWQRWALVGWGVALLWAVALAAHH